MEQIPTIMLVEDDPDLLRLLHRVLRELTGGYAVVPVGSAADALAQITLRPVPLLITDYHMTGMTGLDLTRAVKARSPTTYIALITAYATPDLERQARAVGVDSYLPKPFALQELEAIVRAALAPPTAS